MIFSFIPLDLQVRLKNKKYKKSRVNEPGRFKWGKKDGKISKWMMSWELNKVNQSLERLGEAETVKKAPMSLSSW